MNILPNNQIETTTTGEIFNLDRILLIYQTTYDYFVILEPSKNNHWGTKEYPVPPQYHLTEPEYKYLSKILPNKPLTRISNSHRYTFTPPTTTQPRMIYLLPQLKSEI